MEFFGDIFWLVLVGLWIFNQARGLTKRQGNAINVQDQGFAIAEEMEERQLAQDSRKQERLLSNAQNYFSDYGELEEDQSEPWETGSIVEEQVIDLSNTSFKIDHPVRHVRDKNTSLVTYLTGGEVEHLQRAVVLSEVLGPPVSMRKLQE
ncbi:MAG: hypothetical protein OSA24_07035 [Longimicrobiales bacterium]|nr:hypothetical protein [Longimicrobiales bacterium]